MRRFLNRVCFHFLGCALELGYIFPSVTGRASFFEFVHGYFFFFFEVFLREREGHKEACNSLLTSERNSSKERVVFLLFFLSEMVNFLSADLAPVSCKIDNKLDADNRAAFHADN